MSLNERTQTAREIYDLLENDELLKDEFFSMFRKGFLTEQFISDLPEVEELEDQIDDYEGDLTALEDRYMKLGKIASRNNFRLNQFTFDHELEINMANDLFPVIKEYFELLTEQHDDLVEIIIGDEI